MEININDTNKMLQHLHGNRPGYSSFFPATRNGKVLEPTRLLYMSNERRTRNAIRSRVAPLPDDTELYVSQHLYTSRRRNAANVEQEIWTLFVDGDGASVPATVPPPTLILETSPGRHQYIWRLSATVSPEKARELNRRLAHAIGGDPSGGTLSQLMRVPGSHNQKYKSKPEVRLLEVHDDIDD